MGRALSLPSLALALILASVPATAQHQTKNDPPRCGARSLFVEHFSIHRFRPQAMAITAGGALLEVYVSLRGEWSILVTPPAAPSCITAQGEFWEVAIGEEGS